jgi:hypothetical protein
MYNPDLTPFLFCIVRTENWSDLLDDSWGTSLEFSWGEAWADQLGRYDTQTLETS